jgi:N-acyl-D-aspartate/D-glutamate deacylase
MMRASGRPLSFSLSQGRAGAGYRHLLDTLTKAQAEGLVMRGQVAARPIGVVMGLQTSLSPLRDSETFRALEGLPRPELVARLSDQEVRGAILAELAAGDGRMTGLLDVMFELSDPPDYEPVASSSVAARAARLRISPVELMYDLLLGGDAPLYWPFLNYADGSLDAAAEMMAHPQTVPGLSDGGAHVGTICDASFPTTLLAHWGRDRTRGPKFEIEWLVQQQCRATAEALGLLDRGVLAPGYKADINVIDFDRLSMGRPRLVFDLPAGGKRLLQDATGYVHTFVSGVEIARDGEPTGATPGRLVRGAQPDPTP